MNMQNSFQSGVVANLPVSLSVAAYGGVLGVLAAQKGLTGLELLAMNLMVFAGSAQFVIVEMWTRSLPIFEITLAVLAVNMRYLLIGASLKPVFSGQPLRRKLYIMHFVADENWAVTMAAHRKGKATIWFLFGGGLCLITFWCAGTLSGHGLGSFIQNPETYAMDFAFIAVFTALAVSLWRGKQDLLPWIIAAGLAVATEKLIPGKWYIITGGVGGALISAIQHTRTGDEAK